LAALDYERGIRSVMFSMSHGKNFKEVLLLFGSRFVLDTDGNPCAEPEFEKELYIISPNK
jgi:hypothetical protein